jgi:hypothetical protein
MPKTSFAFQKTIFTRDFFLNLWKKLSNYMFYHVWQNVFLQQVLIFGCPKELMTFFALVINFLGTD